MLCAATAAERGLDVILLEPNRMMGKKLRITGKGRCNVTNNCDIKTVMANIPTGGKFLYSALNRFPPEKVMDLFENLGVPLKTERGNRVFPISDKSGDIVSALENYMAGTGVQVVHRAAQGLRVEDGVAMVEDRSCYAGSVQALDRMVRNMVFDAGLPLADAVRMASLTPARVIGLDGCCGSIEVGKRADLCVLDADLNVIKTVIAGKVVWEKGV